jgi:hypothetical protein
MSESTTPPPSDDLPAAFDLALRRLKERRHLAFDELADVLKSQGYPIAGEHPYIYRQDTCLMAWVGMSHLFWTVAERLRRHRSVRIERAVHLRPSQYPPNLRLPSPVTTPVLSRNRIGCHANSCGEVTHDRRRCPLVVIDLKRANFPRGHRSSA